MTSCNVDQPTAKVSRQGTNVRLCLTCQQDLTEKLVDLPCSYKALLQYIRERAAYGDEKYLEISMMIGDLTEEDLLFNGVT